MIWLRSALVWWMCLTLAAWADPGSRLTPALNEKALQVWRNLGNSQSSGCFSPVSLWFLLALLEAGSGPRDEPLLGSFLAEPPPLSPRIRQLESLLASSGGFHSANSFWHGLKAPLKPDFQKLLDRHQRVDFSQPHIVSEAVNHWADQATRGQISKLVTPADVGGAEALLINTVLFEGRWKVAFDPTATLESAFHLEDGRTISLPMMRQHMLLAHFSNAEAQGAVLDYSAETGWSYLAIMPASGNTLANLESGLTWDKLQQWLAVSEQGSETCWLPRYQSSSRHNLAQVLKSSPLAAYFQPGVDFSRLSAEAGGLYISQILQNAQLEVSEKGTTAAAATVAIMTRGVPEDIRFDRPFLYFVLDSQKTILFMGRFVGR